MADNFETAYREAVMLRENFADYVTEAIKIADSEDSLKKLLNVTVRFMRICSDLQQDIATKLAHFTIAPPAPCAPSIVADGQKSSDGTSFLKTATDTFQTQPAPTSLTSGAQVTTPNKKTEFPAVDLTKVRIESRTTDLQFLHHIPCCKVFFPYLNPDTTEETLRRELKTLDLHLVDVQLFLWGNRKCRGTAVVTLKDAAEALNLVARRDLQIDGWSVQPKILLLDLPGVASAETEMMGTKAPSSNVQAAVVNVDEESASVEEAVKVLVDVRADSVSSCDSDDTYQMVD